MTSDDKTLFFLNIGHAWDHLAMLIFPTVILAMTAEFGLDYAGLLQLSIGGFIAFARREGQAQRVLRRQRAEAFGPFDDHDLLPRLIPAARLLHDR